MDFSPLVSDSETRGEKNPSHMENHTKCISSFVEHMLIDQQHIRDMIHKL